MAILKFTLAGLAVLANLVSAQNCPGVTGRFQPKMGAGYRSSVLSTSLRTPRHIIVDTAGNLLVANQNGGTITRLVLTENGQNVCVGSTTQVTTEATSNHGVALSADGKILFVSNLNQVSAYTYDATTGVATNKKTIITGMTNGGTHPTRAIFAPPNTPDVLLVARGAQNNIDTTTTSQSAGRGMIKQFSIAQLMASTAAVQFVSAGEVLGWGMRNIVGMGEDPTTGGVYSVENSLDDARLGGRDVHNDNPAERLVYHGKPDPTNTLKGAHYGYPYCFAAWDLGNGAATGSFFTPDSVPTGGNCATRTPAALHLKPHTAPLDVKFTANGTSAYIAFHGSWNRSPPDGYRVMRVDFKNGRPVASPDSKTAEIAVMQNANTGSCPGQCFRPVGLAFDKKGRLFMSSDSSNEIYVIYGA